MLAPFGRNQESQSLFKMPQYDFLNISIEGSGDTNRVVIDTPQGEVTMPDLSGLSLVNDYDHDCKTCNPDKRKYNPGNCWNVDPQPYLNSWNEWDLSQKSTLILYLNSLDAQGNYSKGEEVALEVSAWASEALADLDIHIAWVNNMQNLSNWNKENRCCVDRTGGNNFANGVDPKQDELKAKLQSFKDLIDNGYVRGFQGVAPDTWNGEDVTPPQVGPGASPSGGGTSPGDTGDLKKFLLAGGAVLVLLTVIVIFARRK